MASMIFHRPRKKTSMRFLLSLLLALGVSALMLAAQGFNDKVFHADAALVLAGEVYPDASLSPRFKTRIDVAFGLYYYGTVKNIIVSGNSEKPDASVADAVSNYLLSLGVRAEHIIVDSDSSDVKESAHFAAEYMKEQGWAGIIAVSQFFDLPRLTLCLRHEGVPLVGSLSTRNFAASDIFYLLREIPAYFSYWAKLK